MLESSVSNAPHPALKATTAVSVAMQPDPRIFRISGVLIMVSCLISCAREAPEPSAARKALDELQRQYDELLDDKLNDPVQWAEEDIENIGDWDYRVENIPFAGAEDLQNRLNELGDDRWEVIWLERTPDGFLTVLKKPSISYLSKIPLSQLSKFVIGGPESQE